MPPHSNSVPNTEQGENTNMIYFMLVLSLLFLTFTFTHKRFRRPTWRANWRHPYNEIVEEEKMTSPETDIEITPVKYKDISSDDEEIELFVETDMEGI